MNRFYKFENDVPPKDLKIWWNTKSQTWELWFAKEDPMFDDGVFAPFTGKLYSYEKKDR